MNYLYQLIASPFQSLNRYLATNNKFPYVFDNINGELLFICSFNKTVEAFDMSGKSKFVIILDSDIFKLKVINTRFRKFLICVSINNIIIIDLSEKRILHNLRIPFNVIKIYTQKYNNSLQIIIKTTDAFYLLDQNKSNALKYLFIPNKPNFYAFFQYNDKIVFIHTELFEKANLDKIPTYINKIQINAAAVNQLINKPMSVYIAHRMLIFRIKNENIFFMPFGFKLLIYLKDEICDNTIKLTDSLHDFSEFLEKYNPPLATDIIVKNNCILVLDRKNSVIYKLLNSKFVITFNPNTLSLEETKPDKKFVAIKINHFDAIKMIDTTEKNILFRIYNNTLAIFDGSNDLKIIDNVLAAKCINDKIVYFTNNCQMTII